jgi:hypothetical protein
MTRLRGSRGGILRVLLIIFGVLFLCVVIIGVYVGLHWKQWTADFANVAAQEMVKESGLPDDQKEEILSEIRHLGDDFKTGKISTEELAQIMKNVAESPLIALAGVQAAQQKYIEPSDMTAKEKADGILTLQRFARGVYEHKISKETLDDVVKPIAELRPNGNWRLKDHPTRMEIDQFLDNAKARADEAMIPNEPYDLNIADELRKAIHRAEA